MYSLNEFVKYRDKYCIIESIKKTIHGWNQYILEDVFDGSGKHVAHKGELQKATDLFIQDLEVPVDLDESQMDLDQPESVEVQPKKRFAELSTQQIDEIAAARVSHNTNTQTKWAVRILKSE